MPPERDAHCRRSVEPGWRDAGVLVLSLTQQQEEAYSQRLVHPLVAQGVHSVYCALFWSVRCVPYTSTAEGKMNAQS